MKILNIEQRTQEWLDARLGKITGTKLKDIVVKRGTGRKIGFYELLADRLAVDTENEDPMERGARLEQEAIEKFQEMTGLKVDTSAGLCISDKNPNIAYSPDGLIKEKGKWVSSVEIKCLSTSRHLEAYFEQKIPSDYEFQVLQSFIVNEDQEDIYFVFYDPRVVSKPMFWIKKDRSEVEEDIKTYLKYQEDTLLEIDKLLEQIAF